VIAIARLTFANMVADSDVLLGIILVRSSFAIRYFSSRYAVTRACPLTLSHPSPGLVQHTRSSPCKADVRRKRPDGQITRVFSRTAVQPLLKKYSA